MFKRYPIVLGGDAGRLMFYVHSRPRGCGGGFIHEAVCLGVLPHTEGVNYDTFFQTDHKIRYHRVGYENRTWESWGGQSCLSQLWDKIVRTKGIDSSKFPGNPFSSDNEPEHENLVDPRDIFDGFTKRT